jgi:energy-coupling factor transporter ATP-binding protein EcfA2
MNAPEDLNRLYSDVSDSIGSAMADILNLNVEHKDGKREIGTITEKLRDIQSRFDSELHQLKTHAEWDTFTLAFFGETNAGKSTIIESLRILFKEESRQALLQQNADDLEALESALKAHLDNVRGGLHDLYTEYTGELASISQSTSRLNKILKDESAVRLQIAQQEAEQRQKIAESEALARAKLAEQETNARLAAEQEEASQRLQIVKAQAASSFKTRLILFSIGGLVIGVAGTTALLKLAGA